MKFFKIAWKSFIDFFRDGGVTLAGSMSYFMMMALVPFCLFMITLFGYLLGRYPEFHKFFLNRLVNLFPAVSGEITREIMKLISYKGLGKFSLFLYAFLSYQVFASLENSLNIIFKVRQKRNKIVSILISLTLVTFIIALVIISFTVASAAPLLFVLKPYLPAIKIGKATGFIIRFILPFIMVLFTVTAIYKLLPKAKVGLMHAFTGAVFTTTFLELAKHVFTWYVGTIAQFGKLYGSLTVFVIFLLWMFYSSCIFLIGAEVVYNLRRSQKVSR